MAARSADLIQAAHQQATRNWWVGRNRFELFISRAVVTEAGRGDPDAAARRMEALQGIPNLQFGRDVAALARRLVRSGALPPKARLDAAHVAVAAVNGMDYLLTWNLRHLANAALRGKIEGVCRDVGTVPPIILHAGGTHGAEVMTRRDPIVEEVRKHREAIAREHGNDLDAIIAAFQRQDASDDRATVSFPPKRLVDRRSRSKATKAQRPTSGCTGRPRVKSGERPPVSRRG